MNLENENNAKERRPRKKSGRDKNPPNPEVGNALRSIYQRTIDEQIPSEMLDLLGKLG